MMDKIGNDHETSENLLHLASEVEQALKVHAVVHHEVFGDIYAYEVNGFGSYNLMDDANIPSLLSLPYLEAVDKTDPVYLNTRKFVLSRHNPFFFKGQAGEGIGGPHVGMDMIWPLSIIMRGLTSEDSQEKKQCIEMLKNSHGGTGFMHESFYKDDATKFTRSCLPGPIRCLENFCGENIRQNPVILIIYRAGFRIKSEIRGKRKH